MGGATPDQERRAAGQGEIQVVSDSVDDVKMASSEESFVPHSVALGEVNKITNRLHQ
jgi:hypothetical protein